MQVRFGRSSLVAVLSAVAVSLVIVEALFPLKASNGAVSVAPEESVDLELEAILVEEAL